MCIRDSSHPLQNFTEIVPANPSVRGVKRKRGSKIERCHVRVSHLLISFLLVFHKLYSGHKKANIRNSIECRPVLKNPSCQVRFGIETRLPFSQRPITHECAYLVMLICAFLLQFFAAVTLIFLQWPWQKSWPRYSADVTTYRKWSFVVEAFRF